MKGVEEMPNMVGAVSGRGEGGACAQPGPPPARSRSWRGAASAGAWLGRGGFSSEPSRAATRVATAQSRTGL